MLLTPLPCAASLCFSFFRWAPFCSGDQSDSDRAKPHGSQGDAIVQRSRWMDYLSTELCRPTLLHLEQQSPTFLAPGTSFMEDSFSTDQRGAHDMITIMVYRDDSSTFYLLHSLLLSSVLHQLLLRSSGTKSWRLGTPGLMNTSLFLHSPRGRGAEHSTAEAAPPEDGKTGSSTGRMGARPGP